MDLNMGDLALLRSNSAAIGASVVLPGRHVIISRLLQTVGFLFCVLGLSACAATRIPMPHLTLPSFAPRAAPIMVAKGDAAWPQSRSDLAADPTLRFGILPNGMRYILRHNATPKAQAALRLWLGTGSLQEREDQLGLAHFLEHMAFNGSKSIPEGEMVKILERHGLAFGADTNAATSYDSTVYQLDLPHTDADTVDQSLKILREVASELTIAPNSVDRERGVVLSEERTRASPSYQVFKDRFAFLFAGQRPPLRDPIGSVSVLKSAPASVIADYYRTWYRPERAVLVAVGDFDLDSMESKLKAGFTNWQAQAPAQAEPDLGPVSIRSTQVHVAVIPGARAALQLSWVRPVDFRGIPKPGGSRICRNAWRWPF